MARGEAAAASAEISGARDLEIPGSPAALAQAARRRRSRSRASSRRRNLPARLFYPRPNPREIKLCALDRPQNHRVSTSRARRRGLCARSRAVLGVGSRCPPPLESIARRAPRGVAPKALSASRAPEDAVEVAKSVRKSPLTRARPRVPAKTPLTYLQRRARAWDPPPARPRRSRRRRRCGRRVGQRPLIVVLDLRTVRPLRRDRR